LVGDPLLEDPSVGDPLEEDPSVGDPLVEDPEPVVEDPDPVEEDPLVADPLPPAAMAAAWNAANELGELGLTLTAKTMPLLQWTAGVVCAQKNHSGVVESVTLKLN